MRKFSSHSDKVLTRFSEKLDFYHKMQKFYSIPKGKTSISGNPCVSTSNSRTYTPNSGINLQPMVCRDILKGESETIKGQNLSVQEPLSFYFSNKISRELPIFRSKFRIRTENFSRQ